MGYGGAHRTKERVPVASGGRHSRGALDPRRANLFGLLLEGDSVRGCILCVDLARPPHPDIWSNVILDVSVKVVFHFTLSF